MLPIDPEFYKFRLRDFIEILVILTGVILYISGGLGTNAADVRQNTKDISTLTGVMTLESVDTRHNSEINAVQQQQINQNSSRIDTLEKNYKEVYDVMVEVRGALRSTASPPKR